jgi:hypothetical protein
LRTVVAESVEDHRLGWQKWPYQNAVEGRRLGRPTQIRRFHLAQQCQFRAVLTIWSGLFLEGLKTELSHRNFQAFPAMR